MKILIAIFGFLVYSLDTSAQQPPAATAKGDSAKVVEIISAERYGFKRKDSATELLLLVGKVALKQDNTRFYADSAVYNRKGKFVEAFGNVHINDNDSIDTYSDYLLYHTDTKLATLKKNVRLTDGKSNLFTEELEYDVNQKIGIYRNGGRVVNGTSTLTSLEGTYYADIKDVYFRENVNLTDPKYKLMSDSLLYNTGSELATFITKTFIEDSAKRTIVTSEGYYDLKNKNASFGARPVIRDGPTTTIANQIDTDDNTGISVLTGNAVFKDTAQGISLLANHIVSNKRTGSLVATRKPLMIIKQENDSTFITADTLYSGRLSELEEELRIRDSLQRLAADTTVKTNVSIIKKDSLAAMIAQRTAPQPDSLGAGDQKTLGDSLEAGDRKPFGDSALAVLQGTQHDSTVALKSKLLPDSSIAINRKPVVDSTVAQPKSPRDTTIARNSKQQSDSADRFFRAYHNVRIFSDSLQAVSDSLFYSGKDSIFRLFRDPIVWSGVSQVTGDTIYLATKNKKPHTMYVFEHGFMVNRSAPEMYNQVKGTRIYGYFKEGDIDYIRAKGNAESVYYAKDSEDKLVGINKATSDIIDMRFRNKELNKVVFINAVTGSMLPYRQATEQDRILRGFKWQDERRPKSKFELFGN